MKLDRVEVEKKSNKKKLLLVSDLMGLFAFKAAVKNILLFRASDFE